MGRGQISAVGQIDAYHLRESGFLRYHIFANKPAVAGLFGDPSEVSPEIGTRWRREVNSNC
jgi:hypothetical protein